MSRSKSWGAYALIGVVIVAGLAIAFLPHLIAPAPLHGSPLNPPTLAADFSLPQVATGAQAAASSFTLADQRGKVVLLFFGYASCTDACPAALSTLHQMTAQLGTDAQRVQVVFISVDPERDTSAITHQYAASFDPAFTGLSGTEAQLSPVWQAYGVYRSIPAHAAGAPYEVSHATSIYLIDPAGRLRTLYQAPTAANLVQDAQTLLKEGN